MNVLLSVKPKYAEEIISGRKKYEFRKSIFKREDIKKMYIYSSSPVKKIIAIVDIVGLILPKSYGNNAMKMQGYLNVNSLIILEIRIQVTRLKSQMSRSFLLQSTHILMKISDHLNRFITCR